VSKEFAVVLGRRLRGVVRADPSANRLTANRSSSTGDRVALPNRTAADQPAVDNSMLQQEHQAIANAAAALVQAARNLAAEDVKRLRQMQEAAVDLACTIASHLIRQKIHRNDFPVEQLVRESIEQLGTNHESVVHLHPDDLALLRRQLGTSAPLFSESSEVSLLGDPNIARGNCRAESGGICAMSQWEEQLKRIESRLREGLGYA
jgi:flagellar biosynthesis/type III secretory pathway protein FliH